MDIDWSALGEVFGVSLVVTVVIVGVFTLGIMGTSRKAQPESAGPESGGMERGGPESGGTLSGGPESGGTPAAPSLPARVGAYLCFAACAAMVAYGIRLIIAG